MAQSEVAAFKKKPRKQCDLIMKGGITSGVVYPEAVLQLHEEYDFCCIGGASAGAIAAAATAAAQHGAIAGGAATGFDGLKALNADLKMPGRLVQLFQPTPAAAPLFRVFLAGLRGAHRGKKLASAAWTALYVAGALLANVPLALLLGAILGVAAFAVFVWVVGGTPGSWIVILLGILAAVGGAVAGAAARLASIAVFTLPKQGFGITRLHARRSNRAARRGAAPQVPLTDWLSQQFDSMAGMPKGRPLTFGDLQARDIELQLITTNLSELRPYVLPLRNHRFLVNRAELAEHFPLSVVRHMWKHRHRSSRVAPPRGYFFLPDAEDLPVVFGVRLSLSFPVLISAVPLYSIRLSAFERREQGAAAPVQLVPSDLRRNWFSDGGICSNFPIHFFDRWLPSRPTFGISMAPKPTDDATTLRGPLEGFGPGAKVESRRDEEVHLPKANRPEGAAWHEIGSMAGLFGSLFNTAMGYRDSMQSELPGFRERIVEVRLTGDEGGLNLDMKPDRIQRLAAKGARAGARLRDEFDFQEHRWVRLQVLLPPLAEELEHLGAIHAKFGDWPDSGEPYSRGPVWTRAMRACMDALAATSSGDALAPLKRDDPRPPATVRVGPRI